MAYALILLMLLVSPAFALDIVLSDKNNHVVKSDDGNEKLESNPFTSVKVIIGNYKLHIPAELNGATANQLHVIIDKSRIFTVDYKGENEVVLNSDTLHNNYGVKFIGTVVGDQMLIAIGHKNNKAFYPYWAGLIVVK